MKLIHITDQHCGGAYPEKVEKSFDFLIEQLWGDHNSPAYMPDLIYSTGDLTDRPLHVHSEHLRPFLRFVKAAQCPIVLLQGTCSHEPLGAINNIAAVSDGKIHVIDSPLQVINVAGFSVQGMPGLTRPLLAKWCREANIPVDGFDDPSEAIRQLLNRMRLQWDIGPRILGGHLTVTGCKTPSGQTLVGNDIGVGLEDFLLANPTVVRLGHIHAAQEWWLEKLHIAFGGSSSNCNWGEMDNKYFRVDLFSGDELVSTETIQYPHRPMIKVELEFTTEQLPGGGYNFNATGNTSIKEMFGVSCPLIGKEVKVVYTIPREIAATIDDAYIRCLFAENGIDIAALEKIVKTDKRERIEGIRAITTTEEQYLAWCKSKNQSPRPGSLEKCEKLDAVGREL